MTPAEAIAQLQQVQQRSKGAMQKGEFTVANNIALTAIQLAPEDTAALVESVAVEQGIDTTSVIVGVPYSGFVEFGTGAYAEEYVATLPDQWQEEARKFFVNGKGKGQPHPFFYPAVQLHQDDIYTEVDAELQKLAE